MPRIKKTLNTGQLIGGKKYHGGKSGKYVYSRNPITSKVKRHRTGK